jgi:N-methylhydantoinase B
MIDPVTLTIVKNALDTIVDDMAYTVMRTARSPIVRDVLDYSCTICDTQGRILTQAKTVALHLGAVPDAMTVVLETFSNDLEDGDVVIFNDPYEGGMHLPDIFMFKPFFLDGGLQGFLVVIAHHCDMGGRVPGSNAADSTEIFQEGLRIPPLKLYRHGERDETLFRIIGKNVRVPDLVFGDLEAQLSTCAIGEREMVKLMKRYGVTAMNRYFDELIVYGEKLTRACISAWPNGAYTFTDYIDSDGFSDDSIAIRCTLTIEGDHVHASFEGSSPQVRGAINCTLSYARSATYMAVRCALDAEVPNNAGVYRCIDVEAPKGSILNPVMPAAVAARALTGYRVADAVLGAVAQIVPERAIAAGEGGNTVVCIGGYDEESLEPFIMVDMINGAWGARPTKDGIEGITNPTQNMSNMPVETLEYRYPIRIEKYSLRPDSCGAGKWRGGIGLIRQYCFLGNEAVLQLRADRARHRPYGLFGGGEAAPSVNILNPGREDEHELPSKVTRQIVAGDVIRHEQPGGGGYGKPEERARHLIDRDLADGKITAAYAKKWHGYS